MVCVYFCDWVLFYGPLVLFERWWVQTRAGYGFCGLFLTILKVGYKGGDSLGYGGSQCVQVVAVWDFADGSGLVVKWHGNSFLIYIIFLLIKKKKSGMVTIFSISETAKNTSYIIFQNKFLSLVIMSMSDTHVGIHIL